MPNQTLDRSLRLTAPNILVALAVLFGLLLLSAPATAQIDTYRVLLKNGNTFVSAERPQIAHFDESKVLLRSLGGHIIALDLDDVEKVESDLEFRGYGTLINKTTIVVGRSANDTEEIDPATTFALELLDSVFEASFGQPLFGTDPQNVGGPVTSGALEAPVFDIPN